MKPVRSHYIEPTISRHACTKFHLLIAETFSTSWGWQAGSPSNTLEDLTVNHQSIQLPCNVCLFNCISSKNIYEEHLKMILYTTIFLGVKVTVNYFSFFLLGHASSFRFTSNAFLSLRLSINPIVVGFNIICHLRFVGLALTNKHNGMPPTHSQCSLVCGSFVVPPSSPVMVAAAISSIFLKRNFPNDQHFWSN